MIEDEPILKLTDDWEYEALPESIKMTCTPKEFRWMTAFGRDRLIQEMTEPDPED